MDTINTGKQPWVEPKLTVFGDVEKLTLGQQQVVWHRRFLSFPRSHYEIEWLNVH